MLWDARGLTIGSTWGHPTRPISHCIADARAIVVAVNLADPLWRVAEAAREAVSEYDDAGLEHDLHYEELAESLRDLRAALADLDAAVKEMP